MGVSTLAVTLTVALIFVNGATDAPTSMAPAVTGKSLSYRRACVICAVFNLLGMLVSGMYFPAVANSMAELSRLDSPGVSCALLSVILFSSAAWLFGIPTSESHGLIAALGGASLYYAGQVESAYIDICIKSVISCAVGLASGMIGYILLARIFPKGRAGGGKSRVSAAFCAASSFWHGAQDGQKFIFLLCSLTGKAFLGTWAYIICSVILGLGCISGGRRIINKTGESLTGGLDETAAVASEASAVVCTAAASLLGIPISTTYMKTSTMIGASVGGGGRVNVGCAAELVLTWLLTYPCCMGLSYGVCLIAERIF